MGIKELWQCIVLTFFISSLILIKLIIIKTLRVKWVAWVWVWVRIEEDFDCEKALGETIRFTYEVGEDNFLRKRLCAENVKE